MPALAAASCGQLIDNVSTSEILQQRLSDLQGGYAFFDIDETILMPRTPFIYGMPKTDAFLKSLGHCEREALVWIGPQMEEAYYAAPLQLVVQGLPSVVRSLRQHGWHVYAATSRSTGDVPWDWHNDVVIEFLQAAGVEFSPLEDKFAHLGNATSIGGIFFVGGEHKDKGDLISQIVPHGVSAVLIDNTRRKLERALASTATDVCLQGLHFVAAHHHEQDDVARSTWLCNELSRANVHCASCGSPGNDAGSHR
ncbi:unnamed protein product [Symbiodinium sp. CCMP2592]|nr:unnamed protein product [Symbiodinium sp. CCMP2592]